MKILQRPSSNGNGSSNGSPRVGTEAEQGIAGVPAPNPKTAGSGDALSQYDSIRSKYNMRVEGSSGAMSQPLSDPHGFYRGDPTDSATLSERYSGIDKLFMTIIRGVVDDPDFALRKDPQVYSRMMRDPQIYYCLNVRKSALVSLDWAVVPPDGMEQDETAKAIASGCEARLKKASNFRVLLDALLSALLPGTAVVELCWDLDEQGQYIITRHHPVNKDRIKLTRDGKLQLLQPMSPTVGIEVPAYKFIKHTVFMTDGSWYNPYDIGYSYYGRGLADTPLYHYFYFKVTALRFLLKSLERESSPTKIYYTGPNNAAVASKLDSILAALHNDAVIGIPGKKGDTNVDIFPNPAKGNAPLFMGFIEYTDKLITRAILGQELMTEMPSVGSYAAAQVHQSVFEKIVFADKDLLENTLTKYLVAYDMALNAPQVPSNMHPRFQFKRGAAMDVSNYLSSVQQAVQLGIRVSESQVREVTGFKPPAPYEVAINDLALQQQQQQMMMQQPLQGPTAGEEQQQGSGGSDEQQLDPTSQAIGERTGKKKEAAKQQKQQKEEES